MRIKYCYIVLIFLFIAFVRVPYAFGQTTTQQGASFADGQITQRITSLQSLLSHISSDTLLATSDKGTLTTSVNQAVLGLSQLKTKIDQDPPTAITADTKSIATQYKVYALLEPQTYLLIAIDELLNLRTRLSSLSGFLSTYISTLQSQGKSVTTLQALASDINLKLEDISKQLYPAQASLNALTVNSTNLTTTFANATQGITKARSDYTNIMSDISSFEQNLQ